MILLRKRFKSRRGITLIELLLASVITVMVIGAAGTALILGFRMFNSTVQTAQSQQKIKLVESALKDHLQTANAVVSGAVEPVRPVWTQKADEPKPVYLYFDGQSFVMQIGTTTLEIDSIQSVEVTFKTSMNLNYALYKVVTKEVIYNGSVVMNNRPVLEGFGTNPMIELSPGSGMRLFMTIPNADDPWATMPSTTP